MPNSRVADSYFEGTLSSSDDVPVYSIWYQGDGSIVVVVGSTCTWYRRGGSSSGGRMSGSLSPP